MMTLVERDRRGTVAIAGIALIVLGGGVFVLRQWGIDPVERIAAAGWPLFVILPGLALLAMAAVPAPPRGVGFAIAGSVVTSVGLLLWWQDQTDRFDTWAYAWALIGPGAAGLALTVYGALTRTPDQLRHGLRLLVVAAVLFLVGAWYFETLFGTGRVPFDLPFDTWWPLGLMAIGAVVVVGELLRGREPRHGKEPLS